MRRAAGGRANPGLRQQVAESQLHGHLNQQVQQKKIYVRTSWIISWPPHKIQRLEADLREAKATHKELMQQYELGDFEALGLAEQKERVANQLRDQLHTEQRALSSLAPPAPLPRMAPRVAGGGTVAPPRLGPQEANADGAPRAFSKRDEVGGEGAPDTQSQNRKNAVYDFALPGQERENAPPPWLAPADPVPAKSELEILHELGDKKFGKPTNKRKLQRAAVEVAEQPRAPPAQEDPMTSARGGRPPGSARGGGLLDLGATYDEKKAQLRLEQQREMRDRMRAQQQSEAGPRIRGGRRYKSGSAAEQDTFSESPARTPRGEWSPVQQNRSNASGSPGEGVHYFTDAGPAGARNISPSGAPGGDQQGNMLDVLGQAQREKQERLRRQQRAEMKAAMRQNRELEQRADFKEWMADERNRSRSRTRSPKKGDQKDHDYVAAHNFFSGVGAAEADKAAAKERERRKRSEYARELDEQQQALKEKKEREKRDKTAMLEARRRRRQNPAMGENFASVESAASLDFNATNPYAATRGGDLADAPRPPQQGDTTPDGSRPGPRGPGVHYHNAAGSMEPRFTNINVNQTTPREQYQAASNPAGGSANGKGAFIEKMFSEQQKCANDLLTEQTRLFAGQMQKEVERLRDEKEDALKDLFEMKDKLLLQKERELRLLENQLRLQRGEAPLPVPAAAPTVVGGPSAAVAEVEVENLPRRTGSRSPEQQRQRIYSSHLVEGGGAAGGGSVLLSPAKSVRIAGEASGAGETTNNDRDLPRVNLASSPLWAQIAMEESTVGAPEEKIMHGPTLVAQTPEFDGTSSLLEGARVQYPSVVARGSSVGGFPLQDGMTSTITPRPPGVHLPVHLVKNQGETRSGLDDSVRASTSTHHLEKSMRAESKFVRPDQTLTIGPDSSSKLLASELVAGVGRFSLESSMGGLASGPEVFVDTSGRLIEAAQLKRSALDGTSFIAYNTGHRVTPRTLARDGGEIEGKNGECVSIRAAAGGAQHGAEQVLLDRDRNPVPTKTLQTTALGDFVGPGGKVYSLAELARRGGEVLDLHGRKIGILGGAPALGTSPSVQQNNASASLQLEDQSFARRSVSSALGTIDDDDENEILSRKMPLNFTTFEDINGNVVAAQNLLRKPSASTPTAAKAERQRGVDPSASSSSTAEKLQEVDEDFFVARDGSAVPARELAKWGGEVLDLHRRPRKLKGAIETSLADDEGRAVPIHVLQRSGTDFLTPLGEKLSARDLRSGGGSVLDLKGQVVDVRPVTVVAAAGGGARNAGGGASASSAAPEVVGRGAGAQEDVGGALVVPGVRSRPADALRKMSFVNDATGQAVSGSDLLVSSGGACFVAADGSAVDAEKLLALGGEVRHRDGLRIVPVRARGPPGLGRVLAGGAGINGTQAPTPSPPFRFPYSWTARRTGLPISDRQLRRCGTDFVAAIGGEKVAAEKLAQYGGKVLALDGEEVEILPVEAGAGTAAKVAFRYGPIESAVALARRGADFLDRNGDRVDADDLARFGGEVRRAFSSNAPDGSTIGEVHGTLAEERRRDTSDKTDDDPALAGESSEDLVRVAAAQTAFPAERANGDEQHTSSKRPGYFESADGQRGVSFSDLARIGADFVAADNVPCRGESLFRYGGVVKDKKGRLLALRPQENSYSSHAGGGARATMPQTTRTKRVPVTDFARLGADSVSRFHGRIPVKELLRYGGEVRLVDGSTVVVHELDDAPSGATGGAPAPRPSPSLRQLVLLAGGGVAAPSGPTQQDRLHANTVTTSAAASGRNSANLRNATGSAPRRRTTVADLQRRGTSFVAADGVTLVGPEELVRFGGEVLAVDGTVVACANDSLQQELPLATPLQRWGADYVAADGARVPPADLHRFGGEVLDLSGRRVRLDPGALLVEAAKSLELEDSPFLIDARTGEKLLLTASTDAASLQRSGAGFVAADGSCVGFERLKRYGGEILDEGGRKVAIRGEASDFVSAKNNQAVPVQKLKRLGADFVGIVEQEDAALAGRRVGGHRDQQEPPRHVRVPAEAVTQFGGKLLGSDGASVFTVQGMNMPEVVQVRRAEGLGRGRPTGRAQPVEDAEEVALPVSQLQRIGADFVALVGDAAVGSSGDRETREQNVAAQTKRVSASDLLEFGGTVLALDGSPVSVLPTEPRRRTVHVFRDYGSTAAARGSDDTTSHHEIKQFPLSSFVRSGVDFIARDGTAVRPRTFFKYGGEVMARRQNEDGAQLGSSVPVAVAPMSFGRTMAPDAGVEGEGRVASSTTSQPASVGSGTATAAASAPISMNCTDAVTGDPVPLARLRRRGSDFVAADRRPVPWRDLEAVGGEVLDVIGRSVVLRPLVSQRGGVDVFGGGGAGASSTGAPQQLMFTLASGSEGGRGKRTESGMGRAGPTSTIDAAKLQRTGADFIAIDGSRVPYSDLAAYGGEVLDVDDNVVRVKPIISTTAVPISRSTGTTTRSTGATDQAEADALAAPLFASLQRHGADFLAPDGETIVRAGNLLRFGGVVLNQRGEPTTVAPSTMVASREQVPGDAGAAEAAVVATSAGRGGEATRKTSTTSSSMKRHVLSTTALDPSTGLPKTIPLVSLKRSSRSGVDFVAVDGSEVPAQALMRYGGEVMDVDGRRVSVVPSGEHASRVRAFVDATTGGLLPASSLQRLGADFVSFPEGDRVAATQLAKFGGKVLDVDGHAVELLGAHTGRLGVAAKQEERFQPPICCAAVDPCWTFSGTWLRLSPTETADAVGSGVTGSAVTPMLLEDVTGKPVPVENLKRSGSDFVAPSGRPVSPVRAQTFGGELLDARGHVVSLQPLLDDFFDLTGNRVPVRTLLRDPHSGDFVDETRRLVPLGVLRRRGGRVLDLTGQGLVSLAPNENDEVFVLADGRKIPKQNLQREIVKRKGSDHDFQTEVFFANAVARSRPVAASELAERGGEILDRNGRPVTVRRAARYDSEFFVGADGTLVREDDLEKADTGVFSGPPVSGTDGTPPVPVPLKQLATTGGRVRLKKKPRYASSRGGREEDSASRSESSSEHNIDVAHILRDEGLRSLVDAATGKFVPTRDLARDGADFVDADGNPIATAEVLRTAMKQKSIQLREKGSGRILTLTSSAGARAALDLVGGAAVEDGKSNKAAGTATGGARSVFTSQAWDDDAVLVGALNGEDIPVAKLMRERSGTHTYFVRPLELSDRAGRAAATVSGSAAPFTSTPGTTRITPEALFREGGFVLDADGKPRLLAKQMDYAMLYTPHAGAVERQAVAAPSIGDVAFPDNPAAGGRGGEGAQAQRERSFLRSSSTIIVRSSSNLPRPAAAAAGEDALAPLATPTRRAGAQPSTTSHLENSLAGESKLIAAHPSGGVGGLPPFARGGGSIGSFRLVGLDGEPATGLFEDDVRLGNTAIIPDVHQEVVDPASVALRRPPPQSYAKSKDGEFELIPEQLYVRDAKGNYSRVPQKTYSRLLSRARGGDAGLDGAKRTAAGGAAAAALPTHESYAYVEDRAGAYVKSGDNYVRMPEILYYKSTREQNKFVPVPDTTDNRTGRTKKSLQPKEPLDLAQHWRLPEALLSTGRRQMVVDYERIEGDEIFVPQASYPTQVFYRAKNGTHLPVPEETYVRTAQGSFVRNPNRAPAAAPREGHELLFSAAGSPTLVQLQDNPLNDNTLVVESPGSDVEMGFTGGTSGAHLALAATSARKRNLGSTFAAAGKEDVRSSKGRDDDGTPSGLKPSGTPRTERQQRRMQKMLREKSTSLDQIITRYNSGTNSNEDPLLDRSRIEHISATLDGGGPLDQIRRPESGGTASSSSTRAAAPLGSTASKKPAFVASLQRLEDAVDALRSIRGDSSSSSASGAASDAGGSATRSVWAAGHQAGDQHSRSLSHAGQSQQAGPAVRLHDSAASGIPTKSGAASNEQASCFDQVQLAASRREKGFYCRGQNIQKGAKGGITFCTLDLECADATSSSGGGATTGIDRSRVRCETMAENPPKAALRVQRSGSLKPIDAIDTKLIDATTKDHGTDDSTSEESFVKQLQEAHVELEKAREEKLATGEELGKVLLELQEAQKEIEVLRQEKLEAGEKVGELVQELQEAQIELEVLKGLCAKNGVALPNASDTEGEQVPKLGTLRPSPEFQHQLERALRKFSKPEFTQKIDNAVSSFVGMHQQYADRLHQQNYPPDVLSTTASTVGTGVGGGQRAQTHTLALREESDATSARTHQLGHLQERNFSLGSMPPGHPYSHPFSAVERPKTPGADQESRDENIMSTSLSRVDTSSCVLSASHLGAPGAAGAGGTRGGLRRVPTRHENTMAFESVTDINFSYEEKSNSEFFADFNSVPGSPSIIVPCGSSCVGGDADVDFLGHDEDEDDLLLQRHRNDVGNFICNNEDDEDDHDFEHELALAAAAAEAGFESALALGEPNDDDLLLRHAGNGAGATDHDLLLSPQKRKLQVLQSDNRKLDEMNLRFQKQILQLEREKLALQDEVKVKKNNTPGMLLSGAVGGTAGAGKETRNPAAGGAGQFLTLPGDSDCDVVAPSQVTNAPPQGKDQAPAAAAPCSENPGPQRQMKHPPPLQVSPTTQLRGMLEDIPTPKGGAFYSDNPMLTSEVDVIENASLAAPPVVLPNTPTSSSTAALGGAAGTIGTGGSGGGGGRAHSSGSSRPSPTGSSTSTNSNGGLSGNSGLATAVAAAVTPAFSGRVENVDTAVASGGASASTATGVDTTILPSEEQEQQCLQSSETVKQLHDDQVRGVVGVARPRREGNGGASDGTTTPQPGDVEKDKVADAEIAGNSIPAPAPGPHHQDRLVEQRLRDAEHALEVTRKALEDRERELQEKSEQLRKNDAKVDAKILLDALESKTRRETLSLERRVAQFDEEVGKLRAKYELEVEEWKAAVMERDAQLALTAAEAEKRVGARLRAQFAVEKKAAVATAVQIEGHKRERAVKEVEKVWQDKYADLKKSREESLAKMDGEIAGLQGMLKNYTDRNSERNKRLRSRELKAFDREFMPRDRSALSLLKALFFLEDVPERKQKQSVTEEVAQVVEAEDDHDHGDEVEERHTSDEADGDTTVKDDIAVAELAARLGLTSRQQYELLRTVCDLERKRIREELKHDNDGYPAQAGSATTRCRSTFSSSSPATIFSGAPEVDTTTSSAASAAQHQLSLDAKREILTRNYQFFGDRDQASIEGAYVIVVGVGGVGSHAATALARSGVGKLRLIDFDQVSASSLNRHACSQYADIGSEKVFVVKESLQKVAPFCKIDVKQALFSMDRAEELLLSEFTWCQGWGDYGAAPEVGDNNKRKPDFVIDCIDNLPTKCDLIQFCSAHSIPIISSGGMAAKADPTKLRVASLTDTVECELAKRVRQELRLRNKLVEGNFSTSPIVDAADPAFGGLRTQDVDSCSDLEELQDAEELRDATPSTVDPEKPSCSPSPSHHDRLRHAVDLDSVPVVFSVERTSRCLMPLKEHQTPDNAREYAQAENFRVRTLPVTAPVPACAGYTLASFVLGELARQPAVQEFGTAEGREPLKQKTYRRFLEKAKLMLPFEANWVALADAERLLYEVYRRKGCVTDTRGEQLQLVPVDEEQVKKVLEQAEVRGVVPAGARVEAGQLAEGGTAAGAEKSMPQEAAATPEEVADDEEEEEEIELDDVNLFDMEVDADDLEKPAPKFYSHAWNWVLLNKSEAMGMVKWYNHGAAVEVGGIKMKAPLRPRNHHDRELRREEPPSYCWRDECTVAPCSLYLVLLSNFVDYLGSCINVIILPFLVTERFGGSPVWIGGILAAKSLSSAVFPPVIAGLADRYGRATVLRAANFGCGVAVLLQAFAQSLVQLMAASFVVGSFVVVLEVCQVYITDVCIGGVEKNPERIGDSAGDEGTGNLADNVDSEVDGRGEARQPLLRTRMLNYLQATAPLAAVFGPVLGGFLSQISWAFPYYFAAGLSLGMGVLNCLFLAESPAWLATRVRDADAAEVQEVDGAGRHVSVSSELFSTALASNNKKDEISDDTKQREVLVSLRAQVLTAIYTDNALRNFTSGGSTAVFAFFCAQRLLFSVIETSYVLALASLAIVLATTTVIGRLQTCFGHRDLIAYAAVATGAFMACIDLVALGFLHQDAPQEESVPQMNKQVTEGAPLLFACLTVTVILLNIAHTARTCSQPCLLALAAPDVATRGQVFGLLCMYGNVGRVAGSVLASLSTSAVSLDAPWWFLGAVGVWSCLGYADA
eukprot:g852.t1